MNLGCKNYTGSDDLWSMATTTYRSLLYVLASSLLRGTIADDRVT